MYLGALRAQSRTSLIAFIQGTRGILILGLAFALTGIMGATGAGIAVLASQVIVAVAVAPGMLSLLRRKPPLSAGPIPPRFPIAAPAAVEPEHESDGQKLPSKPDSKYAAAHRAEKDDDHSGGCADHRQPGELR